MDEEVLRIQRMVAEKKITPEESMELLASLGKNTENSSASKEEDPAVEQSCEKSPRSFREFIRPLTIREAIAKRLAGPPLDKEQRAQLAALSREYLARQQTLSTGLYMAFWGAVIAAGGAWILLSFGKDAGIAGFGLTVLCGLALLGGTGVALTAVLRTFHRDKNRRETPTEPNCTGNL